MDALVCHRSPDVSEVIAARLRSQPHISRADVASGEENVVNALRSHHYDIQVVDVMSVPVCRRIHDRAETGEITIHDPHRRILIGYALSALSVNHALQLGYDAIIDLTKAHDDLATEIMSHLDTPPQLIMLASTGVPLASVLHDRTDQFIIERIVQGFTDSEIAEQLS